ncbi:enolase C-terminal domain-like protein [Paractinoplanes durhamensis]|uniref:Mandelate racemase/muconate lactonizing enzyme C-terminal domain-containing protein n=1 Tax=Paractinoplanes durhamensis TaxID=113563 RepID=A0ABQ3Z6Y2_9ACTN|nr:enolase C-terminal domain-like protein [Actinoplanes durhamensis]GIE05589.1 hypothetical protein Adu01nite_69390 [Actinoplanes durhamensis]
MVRDLSALADQGWQRLKVKIGKPDWREDAKQRWDLSTANRMLPVLAEAGMDWFEEPVHADDVPAHRRLQAAAPFDIAAGESLYTYHAFANFIAADALRVIQVDVTRVGGVTEWLQTAQHAAANGLRVVPHAGDMMQVHQHLAGTFLSESAPLLEFIPWTQDAFTHRSVIRNGYAIRPQNPGASTTIATQAREKWQISGLGATTAQQ